MSEDGVHPRLSEQMNDFANRLKLMAKLNICFEVGKCPLVLRDEHQTQNEVDSCRIVPIPHTLYN